MNADAIIGRLTQEETAELMAACIDALPEDQMCAVLEEKLSDDLKAELAEGWFVA